MTTSDIDRSKLRWDMEADGVTLLPIERPHPFRWRDADDETFLELWLPEDARWKRLRKANWLPFLEGFAAGLSLLEVRKEATAKLPHRSPAQIKFLFSRVVGSLQRWGLMRFVLPAMPPRLADRYVIEKELGRGGMGVVWLARDERRGGERVAVKHAWNGLGAFAAREKTLREEHRLMAALDHPRIVKPLDTFEVDGRFHLVRAYLDAVTLTRVDPARRADPAFRLSVVRQASDIVASMLDVGYFYLDLKPSNFFVDAKGVVTLGDLGLVKRVPVDDRVVRGQVGTFAYAAPEMFERLEAGEAALVYALGLLHWELVVGAAPKAKSDPSRLLARLDKASATERALLEAVLRKDPAERPQTVRDLVARIPE